MIIFFGCTFINPNAVLSAKAAVRSASIDMRNGRVLNIRESINVGERMTRDEMEYLLLDIAVLLHDKDGRKAKDLMKEDVTMIISSQNPYQGIKNEKAGSILKLSAVENAVGTGKYVVDREGISSLYETKGYMVDLYLNMFENIIRGSDKLITDESRNDNTYIIEVKYSDTPIVTYYNGNTRTVSFKVGGEFKNNGIKYRIIDAAGNVSAIALTGKAKKVTIPDAVDLAGYKMNVTDIADNFMKGDKKATNVTIGENVTSIGKQAFYKCKKLKKVTIKSTKLKAVGKKAFGKNAKKFSVKMPKSCKKTYKKLFKKAKVKI